MRYNIKAHPTIYQGVQFRSRLEARWAAFFDLAGWDWEYEPIDLDGWSPDFSVKFYCSHSECFGSHSLLVEVKPYFTIDDFHGHPCLNYPYGSKRIGPGDEDVLIIPVDASAAFGANPDVTYWEMGHGSGGGDECVKQWVDDADHLWRLAGNAVQYKPR